MAKKQSKLHSQPKPSLEALKELILGMAATGSKGFEGLVARLVEKVTNEQVFLAKSGTQRGDGVTLKGTIAIQAKRYRKTTSLNLNELEGEIQDLARRVPELEVYILGTTQSAQDIERLRDVERQTGVSVVALDWQEKQASKLAALCSIHWNAISDLIPVEETSTHWKEWASQNASNPENIDAEKGFTEELRSQIRSYRYVADIAKVRFLRKFGGNGEAVEQRAFNYVSLSVAVRRSIETDLWDWWQRGSTLALIQGQEGMGKTWVAARFCARVATESQAPVFWLDSRNWSDIPTFDEVIRRALTHVVDDSAILRMTRKVTRTWNQPVLVVLDGLNERDALTAGRKIVEDIYERVGNQSLRASVRVLFTSRELAAKELHQLCPDIRRVSVGPYNDSELVEALKSLHVNVCVDDFPEALRNSVARIPRYLPTCCRLFPTLGSLHHVSVELVLWHDLLDRVERDMQIRAQLGLTDRDEVEDVLCALAKRSVRGEASCNDLNDLFHGRYQVVRHDLVELGWLRKARLGDTASPIGSEHLRLAWALYIRQFLRNREGVAEELESAISNCLEPIPAEDQRTSALLVCSRLGVVEPESLGSKNREKMKALLMVWLKSRNVEGVSSELDFWLSTEWDLGIEILEKFACGTLSSDSRRKAIVPLAERWEQGGNEADELKRYLERWLLTLCGSPEAWGAKGLSDVRIEGSQVVIQGHYLPWSSDERELQMCGMTISLLSLRPDYSLLRALALATATEKYSLSRVNRSRVNESRAQNEMEWVSNKQVWSVMQPLMRWSYTERALPELQRLAHASKQDPLLLYGLQWLCAFLWQTSTPNELLLPPDCGYRHRASEDPGTILKARQELLAPNKDARDELEWLSHTSEFASMSIRPEIDWADNDRRRIIEAAERFVQCGNAGHSEGFTIAISWVARWDARHSAELLATIQTGFQLTERSLVPHDSARWALPSPDLRLQVLDAIREKLSLIANEKQADYYIWAGELLALSLEEEEWWSWLQWAGERPLVRRIFRFLPTPDIVRWRLPDALVPMIHTKLKDLPIDVDSAGMESEFAFWAMFPVRRDFPCVELFYKLRDWLMENSAGREWHPLFELLLSVAPSQATLQVDLEGLSRHPQLQAVIQKQWQNDLFNYELLPNTLSYEDLKKWLPWDALGDFLIREERWVEFRSWGCELIQEATSLLESSKEGLAVPGKLEVVLGHNGHVSTLREPQNTASDSLFVTASSAWLADRTAPDSVPFASAEGVSERDRRVKTWSEWLNKACSHLEGKGRLWLHFSGKEELIQWAMRHPAEFEKLALPFLTRVEAERYGSLFSSSLVESVGIAIAFAWQAVDPAAATDYRESTVFRWNIVTSYGLSEFDRLSWRKDFGLLPHHVSQRRKQLLEAKDDLHIARLTVSAQEVGSGDGILELALELSNSDLMKERALAVSILAWIEDPRARNHLSNLAQSDAATWVREHARWGIEVWLNEKSAKNAFGEAALMKEPWRIALKLVQLRPALTFAARWWLGREIKKLFSTPDFDPTAKSILYRALYRFESRRSSKEKVWGRNLQDYWRGEKIDAAALSIYPLWDPDFQ